MPRLRQSVQLPRCLPGGVYLIVWGYYICCPILLRAHLQYVLHDIKLSPDLSISYVPAPQIGGLASYAGHTKTGDKITSRSLQAR